jgi:hypothetical protein
VLAACSGVTADPGLAARFRVANAQFYIGAPPSPSSDTRVTAIDSLNNSVWAGQLNKALAGRVAGAGRSVALRFPDDVGYWIVPVGAADQNMPDQLTWSAKVSFAEQLAPGGYDLQVFAIDGTERFGPPSTLTLTVRARQLDATKTKLAFALRWDTETDLDLHVVVPSDPPAIVWARSQSSYVPPPGEPADPGRIAAAGTLDFDSNAQCVIDGRREENVSWRSDTGAPPHGSYAVLIDTFSLCAANAAHWSVDVFVAGDPTPVAHAEGVAGDADTRSDHTAGSGLRALVFDY